jgi:hypothetical protein
MAGPSSHGSSPGHTSVSVALFVTAGGGGESGSGSVGDDGKQSESENCAAMRTHEISWGRVGSTRGIM